MMDKKIFESIVVPSLLPFAIIKKLFGIDNDGIPLIVSGGRPPSL
jgi:hypothetical protein